MSTHERQPAGSDELEAARHRLLDHIDHVVSTRVEVALVPVLRRVRALEEHVAELKRQLDAMSERGS